MCLLPSSSLIQLQSCRRDDGEGSGASGLGVWQHTAGGVADSIPPLSSATGTDSAGTPSLGGRARGHADQSVAAGTAVSV